MSETKRGSERERQGMETAASFASHLIFPTVFGLFTSRSQRQVHSLYPSPMPGRRQSAWTLRSFCQSVGHMGQNNNKLGFPCRHNLPPFPPMTDTNLFHFLFAVSYSSSPLIASILGKPSSLRGATVTVQDQEPYWRSVQPHPHPPPISYI